MSEVSEVRVEYKGVEIRYSESENVWEFQLGKRTRQAVSLWVAKETVDRANKRARTPMTPVKAIYCAYPESFDQRTDEIERVDVTAYAGRSVYQGYQFNAMVPGGVGGRKVRRKLRTKDLLVDSPENLKLLREIARINVRVDRLQNLAKLAAGKLVRLEPTEEMKRGD